MSVKSGSGGGKRWTVKRQKLTVHYQYITLYGSTTLSALQLQVLGVVLTVERLGKVIAIPIIGHQSRYDSNAWQAVANHQLWFAYFALYSLLNKTHWLVPLDTPCIVDTPSQYVLFNTSSLFLSKPVVLCTRLLVATSTGHTLLMLWKNFDIILNSLRTSLYTPKSQVTPS